MLLEINELDIKRGVVMLLNGVPSDFDCPMQHIHTSETTDRDKEVVLPTQDHSMICTSKLSISDRFSIFIPR